MASDIRSRIVETSWKLFHDKGFGETTINDIIREAGIPTAYRLTEHNFSSFTLEGTNCKIKEMPLYAAFCICSSVLTTPNPDLIV